jgi:hypothetical protein
VNGDTEVKKGALKMIEPNKWFALMSAAQRRNDDPIWEKYDGLGRKRELSDVGEALEFAHNAAVEAADITAENAYITTFHTTYDKAHLEAYRELAPPSLAVDYKFADKIERTTGAGIDPNKWYGVMCKAQNRNERLFWNALKPTDGKDLNLVDELLVKARVTAVGAANLAAESAYIATFNAIYDKKHRKTYELMVAGGIIAELLPLLTKQSANRQKRKPLRTKKLTRRRTNRGFGRHTIVN